MGSLTTLADVKGWLRLTAATDDALLTRLITAQSARIETYCSRTFASQAYTDTYDGKDTTALPFDNFPVTAVSSVTIDGVPIPASPAPTSLNPYVPGYRFSETMLSLIGGGFPFGTYRFNRGYQNVIVAYTAGYSANAIPAELAQACIELVSIRYREIDRIGQQSKSIGGETVSFFKGDLPASVVGMLQPYRRVVPR